MNTLSPMLFFALMCTTIVWLPTVMSIADVSEVSLEISPYNDEGNKPALFTRDEIQVVEVEEEIALAPAPATKDHLGNSPILMKMEDKKKEKQKRSKTKKRKKRSKKNGKWSKKDPARGSSDDNPATGGPSNYPTGKPTSDDDGSPSPSPNPVTISPSKHPTARPSPSPTTEPTPTPTSDPTYEPTPDPTPPPTPSPTTIAPSEESTAEPTNKPKPSKSPTEAPSQKPTCGKNGNFNLCIALDMSGSVCNGDSNSLCTDCQPSKQCNSGGQNSSRCCSNFDNVVEFTRSLVSMLDELPIDQDFSVVQFATDVKIASTLKSAKQSVKALNKLEYSGGKTNMVGAINSCQTTLAASPPDRKNLMLLLTDGAPSVPDFNAQTITANAATNVKSQGTFIIPILMEKSNNQFNPQANFLRNQISSDGIVFVADFDGLNDIQDAVFEQVTCQLTPTPEPTISPTADPSPEPTPAQTSTPTSNPTTAFPATLSCPPTLDMVQEIDDQTNLYYAVVPSEPSDGNNGVLCARLEVTGAQWVAFGISNDGLMTGSEAIIGTPDNGLVQKYNLNGKSINSVVPMEESKQTLLGTSLAQEDGMTKIEFTKLLTEPGEIPILEASENIFLYAYGSSNSVGYHARRDSFTMDFSATIEPTTIAPTSTPAGSIHYNGFENGIFPDPQEWTTTNDANAELVWERTTQKANSGVYSIRSPKLENEVGTSASSNATFTTDAEWPAGNLYVSFQASIQMPLDRFDILVDGSSLKQMFDRMTDFIELIIPLSPGQHIIDYVYNYNPQSIPASNLPPDSAYPDRIGAVFIDDMYFVPSGNFFEL